MKRTAVFAFYDADGVVDEYICVLLRAISTHCSRIICVVNGDLTEEGATKLHSLCSTVLRRENEGLDIMAYKEGLNYVVNSPQDEDEILFLNGTFFGPIYPFSELFDVMEKRKDLDFWGITQFAGQEEDSWGINGLGYIPIHIQSYFWAVRKNLFTSADFAEYWEKLPQIHSYQEAISYHEVLFTKHFEELGYIWDTYIRPTWFSSFSAYSLISDPVRLLREQRCPIVKRRSFFADRNEAAMPIPGDAGCALYDFLCENTSYDTSLIVKNIARTENNYDCSLVFGRITSFCDCKKEMLAGRSIAQIIWVTDELALNYLQSSSILSSSSIFVYYTPNVLLKSINKVIPSFVSCEESSADIRSVLAQAQNDTAQFDYVAWLHVAPYIIDKAPNKTPTYERDTASFINGMLLMEHLSEVVDLLAHDKNIGAVVPVPLTHRRHTSPEPEWDKKKEELQNTLPRGSSFSISEETLCAGWNAFVATQECFDLYTKMASLYTPSESETVDYGYVLPLAVQRLGQLTAFGADKRILNRQFLTLFSQVRNLARAASCDNMRREDQVVAAQRIGMSFFHEFFNPKSFTDRVYFALMALLPKSVFMRLTGGRKSKSPYPYDIFRPF